MPSRRTKEDTWREKELLDAIQGSDTQKPGSSKASKSGESSKHRSREEGKDRDRAKHRRPEGEGSHRRESERKEKDKKREKSEGKDREKDRDDDGKSRRRHKDDYSDRRRGEGESASRRKEDKIRTETEDDRARRKEREKEEKHRERRRDKESTRDRERTGDEKKEKEKRKKHKSDDRERSRIKEDEYKKEKRSETKEEGKKERSSKKDRKERSEELAYDPIEDEIEDSTRAKDRRSKHKERRNEKETAREDKHRASKDARKDRRRSHGRDVTDLFDKENLSKRDSIQPLEEEIEEEVTSKRTSVSMRKSSLLNTEEVNEEDIDIDANDYDYADEDFEDYDDDFEDDNGDDDLDEGESQSGLTFEEIEGVDEIRKAIREENQLAESLNDSMSSSRPSTRDEQGDRLPASSPMSSLKPQPRGKINFIAAKQKQISAKVASRTRRRGQELSKLIELDEVGMDLFELQPFNIYEVYMKSFGRLNTEQVAVQTNDDTIDQEVQTDEIETETRWNQFSNEVQSFGGGDEKASNANVGENSFLRQDTRRLNRFLSRATQLCITLLKEVDSDQDRVQNKYAESRTKFSDGYQKFSVINDLTQNRKLVNIDVSQSSLALIAYGKHNTEQRECASPDGIICVWNLNSTSGPQKYLSCGSTPKCCCFSPRKPSFAFAGMEDGSVSAWDLREPDSMHTRQKFGNTEAVIRTETFSTASVYSDETHSSTVVSIGAIASPADPSESSTSELDNNGNGALQVISLEENCTINIWLWRLEVVDYFKVSCLIMMVTKIVIEVFSPDPGGSQQDLGLVPGGKIKLVKSGTILPQMPKRYISMEQMKLFSATKLHIDLPHARSLYIGTEQGVVLHSNRFGNKVNPKYFGVNECDTAKVVSSIDHCPWDLPYILVGCTDGSVSLFNSHQGYPLTRWLLFSRGAAILKVEWSRSKPGVFFTLDEESYFYVWDISSSESGPLTKDLIKSGKSSAINFFLTSDSSEQNQQLVMVHDDNTVEIHKLRKSLSDYSTQTFNYVCARLEEIS